MGGGGGGVMIFLGVSTFLMCSPLNVPYVLLCVFFFFFFFFFHLGFFFFFLLLCVPPHTQFECSTLGPVVQSVGSLTSSLRVISLTVLADSIHNILIFFAEKM